MLSVEWADQDPVYYRRSSTGGGLTHSYSAEQQSKTNEAGAQIVEMIERGGFEAVEGDTVYS